jgi:PAS domain S-box-containing protein
MATRPSDRHSEEAPPLGVAASMGDLSDAVMYTLAEESPDAIVVVDVEGRIAWVNRQAEQVFGYSRSDLLSQAVELLLPDGVHKTHLSHRAAFMDNPRTRRMGVGLDLKARRRGGMTFPVEISLTPLSTGNGHVVIATVRDISERQAIAEEQAALRRVATLVAGGAPPEEMFAAVTAEVGWVVGVVYTATSRYEPDARTVIAAWARSGSPVLPVGTRETLGGPNVPTLVFESGRPARIDRYGRDAGPAAAAAVAAGVRSSVGVPIRVEGQLWGLMNVYSTREEPLTADTEARLAGFTELVATAIANAQARIELTASRARLVATADATRRRIERDLHDGAQQRLLSLALQVRTAQATVTPNASELAGQLDEVATGLGEVIDELREIARGIHPAVLARGGLTPALKALARRSALPVHLDVRVDNRLPEQIELAAYYVISEALTNTAKHAAATKIDVDAEADRGMLRIEVRDDGSGGATFAHGSGLAGLKDRVEALGGQLFLTSQPDAGTALSIAVPLQNLVRSVGIPDGPPSPRPAAIPRLSHRTST